MTDLDRNPEFSLPSETEIDIDTSDPTLLAAMEVSGLTSLSDYEEPEEESTQSNRFIKIGEAIKPQPILGYHLPQVTIHAQNVEPFSLDKIPVDIRNTMFDSLSSYAQNPDENSHAFLRHQYDSVEAAARLASSIATLELDKVNLMPSDGAYPHTPGFTGAESNLIMFGPRSLTLTELPFSYITFLNARSANQFPKEVLMRSLPINELFLTCAYLGLNPSQVFVNKGKRKNGPREIKGLNSSYTINYDLQQIVDARCRSTGRAPSYYFQTYKEIYLGLNGLVNEEDVLQEDVEVSGFKDTLVDDVRQDITYDPIAYKSAMVYLKELGILPSEYATLYTLVVRRPVAVWTGGFNYMKRVIPKANNGIKQLRRSCSDIPPIFTNRLSTIYLETQVHYIDPRNQTTYKRELENKRMQKESLAKILYEYNRKKVVHTIEFGSTLPANPDMISSINYDLKH
jgi:hypothetical protein